MQKVGAYLLERRDGMFDAPTRTAEAASLRAEVQKWLRAKGAPEGATSGTYDAEDGSHATFSSEAADDSGLSWSMIRLDEKTSAGRRFIAGVSVTTTKDSVVVYVSLEAGMASSEISPINVEAKCPRIVRTLLELPGNWYHGASRVRSLERVVGFERGQELALELVSKERTLPWVVVSEIGGDLALPGTDLKLARDLSGLANVARVDENAAWALTDELGRRFSCYLGAVRIYWPHLDLGDDPFRHPLWTVEKLRVASQHQDEILERFLSQLRRMFMRTSALSVVRPREIDTIRENAARRALDGIRASASSFEDYKALAETYATDNDDLRAANKDLKERVDELEARLANAEAQLRYREPEEEAITPDPQPKIEESEAGAPAPGETRFYKKSHSAPSHDIMVRAPDCGHNTWQSGHSGDKAKKGIARLERGQNDWSKLHHCGSCTGGGMWRVVW